MNVNEKNGFAFALLIIISLFLCSCENSNETSSVTSSGYAASRIIMDGNDNTKTIGFESLINSSDNILYAECIGIQTEQGDFSEYALYKFKPKRQIKNEISQEIFYVHTSVSPEYINGQTVLMFLELDESGNYYKDTDVSNNVRFVNDAIYDMWSKAYRYWEIDGQLDDQKEEDIQKLIDYIKKVSPRSYDSSTNE